MVANDFSVIAHKHQVEGVQLVLVLDVDALVHVFQHEDYSGLVAVNDGVYSEGGAVEAGVIFDVCQQIHAEVVEAQIHDGYAAAHFFKVYNLTLQSLKLLAAVLQVTLLVGIDIIVVACGGHDADPHSGLDAGLQIDVIVQLQVWPEVHQLDELVFTANSVNSSESLYDAHGIPMYVVINKVVAVLQVLTFGYAVGGNQNVDVAGVLLHHQIALFGYWGETCQDRVHVHRELGDRRASVDGSGDEGCVYTKPLQGVFADVFV